jgi:hypothetical protein
MPPDGFEPALPAIDRSHTHALEGVATGIRKYLIIIKYVVCDDKYYPITVAIPNSA